MIKGILKIFIGLALLLFGTPLALSWIAFCFGTVIIGIALLFFAPQILFTPLVASVGLGFVFIREGWDLIFHPTMRY